MAGIDIKTTAPILLAREQSADMKVSGRLNVNQEEIAKAAQRRAEEARPREALATLANADDTLRSARLVDQFGVERDASTGEKTRKADTATEENKRYKEATEARKMVTEYLDGGFNAVTNKDALIKVVIDEAIRGNPVLAQEVALMTTGTGGEQEAFAMRILNDPKMSESVKRLFKQFLDNPRAALTDTAVNTAQQRKEQADLEKQAAEAEQTAANTEHGRVEAAYKEFEEDGAKTPRRKLQELNNTESGIDTGEKALSKAKGERDAAELDVETLESERVEVMAGKGSRTLDEVKLDLANAKTKFRRANTVIAEKEAELRGLRQKREDLIRERETLAGRQRELAAEQRRCDALVREKVANVKNRGQELQDALRLRGVEEGDIVQGLKSIMHEAVQSVFDARIKEFDKALTDEVNEMKGKAQTQAEKAITEALQHRLFGPPEERRVGWGLKKIEVTPINTTLVESDYQQLMTNGPDGLIEKMLIDQMPAGTINPETGVDYTPGELKDIADNKIPQQMKDAAVRELLAKKIMTHGIGRQDIYIITGTEWGKGMIAKALETRKEYREQVKSALGEGLLNDRNYWQKLRFRMASQPALFKVLILPAFLFSLAGDHEGHTEQGIAAA